MWWMLGVVAGAATQLQQAALLPWPVYAGWLTAAVLLGPLLWRRSPTAHREAETAKAHRG